MGSKSIKQILFNPPEKSGWNVGFVAMLLIVITIAFPLFVGLTDPDGQLGHFTDMLYGGLIGTILMTLAMMQIAKKKKGEEDLIIIGVQSTYKQVMVVAIGIFVGVLAVVVNITIRVESENILLGSMYGNIDPKAFYLGLLAGVAEELLFRGFFQTFFELALGGTLFARLTATLPASVIFAMFHYAAYPDDPIAFSVLVGIGLVFGLIHALTNDIGSAMLAHVVNNMFAMLPFVGQALLDNILIVIALVAIAAFAFIIGLISVSRRRR